MAHLHILQNAVLVLNKKSMQYINTLLYDK